MSGYYPAGTDLSYFDEPNTYQEDDYVLNEEVECYECEQWFTIEKVDYALCGFGAPEEGTRLYEWSTEATCPHCGDTAEYGKDGLY